MAEPFVAIAIQPVVKAHYVTGKDPKAQKKENVEHYLKLIDRAVLRAQHEHGGREPKLVVFPEGFMGGFGPTRLRTMKTMQEIAIRIPGEETEALAQKCKEYKLYFAGASHEKDDPKYPDKVFMTGFIIDPDGKIALKYRKANTFLGLYTSPHDIWDKYSHDPKDLFPVLETPYGHFGIYICHDGVFPETARCLALNGAEVLIRPNQWFMGNLEQLDVMIMMNRMRALENVAYLVTTNWAASPDSEYENGCGHAMIVDYRGRTITEVQNNLEASCSTLIDVNALREFRDTAGILNNLMAVRMELYAVFYGSKTCYQPNMALERNIEDLDEKWVKFRENIARMKKDGILH
jgi:predicted amidohydrolase